MNRNPGFLYRNVTITGKVGVGKTTLVENLKRVLSPSGWKFHSASQIQRQWMKQNSLPLEQTNLRPDDHERQIDEKTKKCLVEKNQLVVDGWLAGYVARDIQGVLKVLVICSDDALRVDRVANRDNLTIEEAKRLIQEREEQNLQKWQRIYGKHDFWDEKYYDLVIDTYSKSKEESLRMVLEKLGYYNSPHLLSEIQ